MIQLERKSLHSEVSEVSFCVLQCQTPSTVLHADCLPGRLFEVAMLNSNLTKENLLRLEFIVELEQSVGDGFLQATVF
jgi:hypothetical protein